MTVLVAQHRGLAGRVGARGVAGVLTPRQQVAFQGGLEGGGFVVVLGVVLEVWYTWVIIVTLTSSVLWSPQELTMNLNDQIICSMVLMPTHNSITHFTFDFATLNLKNTTLQI